MLMTIFETLTCLYCLCLLGVPFVIVFTSVSPQISGGWTVNLYRRQRHGTQLEPLYVQWWVSAVKNIGPLRCFFPLRDSQIRVLGLRGGQPFGQWSCSLLLTLRFWFSHTCWISYFCSLITFMKPLTCVPLRYFCCICLSWSVYTLSFVYSHCSVVYKRHRE